MSTVSTLTPEQRAPQIRGYVIGVIFVGVALLLAFRCTSDIHRQLRARDHYLENRCQILSCYTFDYGGGELPISTGCKYKLRLTTDGVTYEGIEASEDNCHDIQRCQSSSPITEYSRCWYDPLDPTKVFLARPSILDILYSLFTLLCILFVAALFILQLYFEGRTETDAPVGTASRSVDEVKDK